MKTNIINNMAGEWVTTVNSVSGRIKELLSGIRPQIIGSDFNGWGYSDHDYIFTCDDETIAKILAIKNEKKNVKKPRKRTDEEVRVAWCKKLSKLTGITIEDAQIIAQEKLEYKSERIQEMYDRQSEYFSKRRETLIGQMERANPLRPIKDIDHANAIIEASDRHNLTNYDAELDNAREKAELGEIERDEVRDYARQRIQE